MPLHSNRIQTDRLSIRPFTLADAEFVLQLVNTPSWLTYIGDRGIKSIEDAKNYLINGPFQSYQVNGFGLSMVELTASSIPIGMCGLIRRADFEHVDIGFALLPEYEGKGYGHEAAQAILKHANEELALYPIIAITLESNNNSVQLLKKLGMVFERKILFASEELLLYKQA